MTTFHLMNLAVQCFLSFDLAVKKWINPLSLSHIQCLHQCINKKDSRGTCKDTAIDIDIDIDTEITYEEENSTRQGTLKYINIYI